MVARVLLTSSPPVIKRAFFTTVLVCKDLLDFMVECNFQEFAFLSNLWQVSVCSPLPMLPPQIMGEPLTTPPAALFMAKGYDGRLAQAVDDELTSITWLLSVDDPVATIIKDPEITKQQLIFHFIVIKNCKVFYDVLE